MQQTKPSEVSPILTESEPPPTNRFELTFCGVLVVLVFAIIGILVAVAL